MQRMALLARNLSQSPPTTMARSQELSALFADYRSDLTCLSAPQLSGSLRSATIPGRRDCPGAGVVTDTPHAHGDRPATVWGLCVVSGQPPSTADYGIACSHAPRFPPP